MQLILLHFLLGSFLSVPTLAAQEQDCAIQIQTRTSAYFHAPIAKNVHVEVRYLASWAQREELGAFLGEGVTDTQGQATINLRFPGSPKQFPSSGFLRIHSSWEDVSGKPVIIDLSKNKHLEEVLIGIPAHRWLTVVLEGLNLSPEEEKRSRSFLSLSCLGNTKPIYHFRFGDVRGSGARFTKVEQGDGEFHWEAQIGIPYFGEYRLLASTPHGKVEIPSVHLDPDNLPSPLVMHLAPSQNLQGEFHGNAIFPEGFRASHWQVMAVPIRQPAALDDLPEAAASWLGQRVTPIEEDGSFHFYGLEPGIYRFGFRGSPAYSSSSHPFLLEELEASTGTRNLSVVFPESWLSLDLQKTHEGVGRMEVRLEVDARYPDGRRPDQVPSRSGPQGTRRWPLHPGGHYRLAVWGKGIPLFEHAWTQPLGSKDQAFSIPTASQSMGRLGISHHAYQISHRVLSPQFGVELGNWQALKRDTKAIALPPGEYRVISEGHSSYDCGGNIGESRTLYGRLEEVVRVKSGETTFAPGKPPLAGSLCIQVSAIGAPDDALMAPFLYPLPEGTRVTPFHFRGGSVGMILHPKFDDQPIALSFTPRRNYGIPTGFLTPGDTETAHEVFLPGDYVLEVRLRGYPRQWIDLKIEERQRTTVSVELSNL